MKNIVIFVVGAVGCVKTPEWVESCDCPGQICRWGGGTPICIDPPAECGAAYDGTCDLSLVDEACQVALCPDLDLEGSYSFNTECWADDDGSYKMADCSAPYTF
ncbi:MAG: hypothetical protein ABMA64_41975 [Myxococcota bacterium]